MKLTDYELDEINKELLLTFGYEQESKPRYRLSYTTGVEELRKGIYVKYDVNGNQIASKTELRKVLKYPFNQHRYVLERLFYFKSDELPLANTEGSYEAVYYFENGHHIPLPVTIDIVMAICRILEAPKVHKTQADFNAEQKKQEQEQIEKDYLYLEEMGRLALFYDNAGIFKDSRKIFKKETE